MAFTITHRSGAMEADPPLAVLHALVAELDELDEEHPDVSVAHESGWTLSALPSGRVMYQNVENDALPAREATTSRSGVLELFRGLATGDFQRLESEAWTLASE